MTKMRQQQKKNENNIALGKARLTCGIHDLDMRYVKITCLLCVLNQKVKIIQ